MNSDLHHLDGNCKAIKHQLDDAVESEETSKSAKDLSHLCSLLIFSHEMRHKNYKTSVDQGTISCLNVKALTQPASHKAFEVVLVSTALPQLPCCS